MIEYAKVLLPAVSPWKGLFRKELLKCLNWLDTDDGIALYRWCIVKFSHAHPEILDEVFARVARLQNSNRVLLNMPNPAHQTLRKTG